MGTGCEVLQAIRAGFLRILRVVEQIYAQIGR